MDPKTHRVCKSCSQTLPLENFSVSKKGQNTYRSRCKICRSRDTREYTRANREQVNQRARARYDEKPLSEKRRYRQAYYLENKGKITQRAADAYQEAKVRDPEGVILRRTRGRANNLNIECTITRKDIVIPQTCPVLGMTLRMASGKGPDWDSISLDRINPELGYIPGNVRVISHRANSLKNNATVEELEMVLADLRRLREVP